MSVTITSPISGGAETGFTSPTWTTVDVQASDLHSKQVVITGSGGTVPGSVNYHSVSSPFSVSLYTPKVPERLVAVNPLSGVLPQLKRNLYSVVVRKGVVPLAGQAPQLMQINIQVLIPAGADIADPANVRAAQSAAWGAMSQISSGFGDSTITGYL